MIDPIELAYLAGIIDDSCCIYIKQRKDRLKRPLTVILEIKRGDIAILQLLSDCFGGKITTWQGRGKKYWRWAKTGKPAQDVIRQLRPYFRVHTRDADRALLVGIAEGGAQPRVPPGRWTQLEVRP